MEHMQEMFEKYLGEIKLMTDTLAFFQQQRVDTILKEAIEKAYKQGREDERYYQKGPATKSLYE